jgi:hypothetical protein
MLRAVTVCVDYADILAITLPYNRGRFDEVLIVTSTADTATQKLAWDNNCRLYVTDSFYADGAKFSKWRALEEALDACNYRHEWLCNLDADVLIPKPVQLTALDDGPLVITYNDGIQSHYSGGVVPPGVLVSPLRRMWTSFPHNPLPIRSTDWLTSCRMPGEQHWKEFPVHRNTAEWAGYMQIFHADDPVLGPPPWHEVDWVHAGGADSLFQRRWAPVNKIRPPFEVLHLGPAGENWFGRSAPLVDGTRLPGSEERKRAYLNLWPARRAARAAGGDEAATFAPEKIRKQS